MSISTSDIEIEMYGSTSGKNYAKLI